MLRLEEGEVPMRGQGCGCGYCGIEGIEGIESTQRVSGRSRRVKN